MQLAQFIKDITQQGKVTVAGEIIPFTQEDIRESTEHLYEYYTRNLPELAGTVPAFHAEAALWAANYLYRAVQLALLRSAGDEVVNELLTPFAGTTSPETILSVDLSFRYLPDLLTLAKGLAPGDILVKRLREAGAQWPLSSVGMAIDMEIDVTIVMQDDCLRRTYIDRIIQARDNKRCNNTLVNEYIKEALGHHHHLLWPGWEPVMPV